MNVRLALLLSLSMLVIAKNKKLRKMRENKLDDLGSKEANHVYTVVDPTNQLKFGLPVGTKLKLDRKTQLYKPPKLSENFTADDRMSLTWNNNLTRKVYCKVGPGELTGTKFTYDFYWHTWCRNLDGENLCCDKRICDCNAFSNDCKCIIKEH